MRLLCYCLFVLIVVASGSVTHEGGQCGSDAIPYKIVIDRNGRPEVFCETPRCLGHGRNRKQNFAKCNPKFLETVCLEPDEWTGGLIEINNGTHRTLKTQCCTYRPMTESKFIRDAMLEDGDSLAGGVFKDKGRVTGFDLIKEIRKTVTSDNNVQYIVRLHRLPCELTEEEESEDEFIPKQFGVRNKRRMTDGEYDAEPRMRRPRYGPSGRRRRPAGGRRPYYRPEYDDYYDYDYSYPRGRPYGRPHVRMGGDRLWPVAYETPQRAYAVENYATVQDPAGYKEGNGAVLFVEPQLPAPSAPSIQSGPVPPVSSGSYVPSELAQGVSQYQPAPAAPASYSSGPVPPAYNGGGGGSYVAPAAPSYGSGCDVSGGCAPSYSSYPTAPAYPSYPAPSYPAAPSYPSYSSYPSYGYSGSSGSGGLNGLFGKLQCFSGDMEVETPSGAKKMKDLVVGDLVLSIDENMVQFSPIIMFLHKLDAEEATFNRVQLSDSSFLELTDLHLIYVTDCNEDDELRLVHAKDLKAGQCLHQLDGITSMDRKQINNIKKVNRQGIYAPLTSTGDIFVNGILSSCHSNLAFKTLQQTFFSLYRKAQAAYSYLSFTKTVSEQYEVPSGVQYITTVMDLFLPKQFF